MVLCNLIHTHRWVYARKKNNCVDHKIDLTGKITAIIITHKIKIQLSLWIMLINRIYSIGVFIFLNKNISNKTICSKYQYIFFHCCFLLKALKLYGHFKTFF